MTCSLVKAVYNRTCLLKYWGLAIAMCQDLLGFGESNPEFTLRYRGAQGSTPNLPFQQPLPYPVQMSLGLIPCPEAETTGSQLQH